jgi:hypothetical protein
MLSDVMLLSHLSSIINESSGLSVMSIDNEMNGGNDKVSVGACTCSFGVKVYY